MADWVRSPSQRWFTNSKWVDYAFEKAVNEDAQWDSYYGSHPKIMVSPGLNSSNPNYQTAALGQASCGLCEMLLNCVSSANLWNYVCEASKYADVECEGFSCAVCSTCATQMGEPFCDALEQWCNTGFIPCDAIPEDCNFTYNIALCGLFQCEPLEQNKCLDKYGQFVECSSEESICNPCDGSCDDLLPCPCGDGGCVLLPPDEPCPAVCCIPGEPGCVECCPDGEEGCGTWVPIDLCCTSCGDGCQPYGFPMPISFCESCEYCNIDPTAPQCANCCQCPGSSVWLSCSEVEQGACDPPECADFSANCYECNGSYIPIWFGCYDSDPCPNPFNPDCTTGEETVCYDYNTNDPIYYNPSVLGASVIIEYDNPATDTPYAYGNIATLCAVPDSLQLCVYLVNGAGEKTQLSYESDFTINEQAATVTILSSVTVTGFVKVKFERCSDDKRMFLTFKDGAKLSADDLNTSLHQLLFLIQEKEFASNSYYQVANDDGSGNPLFTVTPAMSSPFNFNLTSVAANDVLIWDGNGNFVGSSPSQVAGNMQLDNLSNVAITSVTSGQYLSFNGANWVNSSLPDAPVYFETFEEYNTSTNAALDDYYVQACDSNLKIKWSALPINCVSNVPYDLIPNAITSFGLGYYAAEQQVADQLTNGNTGSALQTFITNEINSTLATGGTILTSLRWEIGRGEGRDIIGMANYPVAYFDIEDFDVLDHPGTGGILDGSNPTASDIAYYRPWTSGTCTTCKNKLYLTNIDKFKFNPSKSRAFGLEFTTGTLLPSTDRYLKRVRSVVNKKDWGSTLGYTESHPLANYPSAGSSYLDYVDGNEMIFAQYQFTDSLDTGNYENTKQVPSIVTYYLSNLWDASSQTPPNYIVWDGNMDTLGKIDASGIPTDVSSYLGANGNYWFYWRWWITGHDTDATGGVPDKYDDLSYYNPFDPSKLSLESTVGYTILPASVNSTDYTADPDDLTMAKTGSYSIKVDANKVFTNLERVLPDMFDEYVFEVQFSLEGRVSTSQCPDAKCYEIVAKIEKHTDGCDPAGTGCTALGNSATNSAGGAYHVYPTDFNANVVRAWDTYPYDKLGIEIRNKTGNGFDLVLKVPRLKRIGLIDVFKDPYITPDGNYRQLALDFITDYAGTAWDSTTGSVPETNSDTDNHNDPPLYDQMHINIHNNSPSSGGSAAAFSLETAVQFIRLGIPANIRVSFYTVTTPQDNLFEG
jgi:hypothetical protein